MTGAFLPQEIIRRKRDGAVLEDHEIVAFVGGFTDGRVTESQIAAFAMAIFFRGMTRAETATLTRAMAQSGRTLGWAELALPGPVLDKHSTGGVGDKVSLMLAPIVAACGGFVPMISGRGLGHTGGNSFDKLESDPRLPHRARHRASSAGSCATSGCAIIGQTADLAPADRRFYAVRDITATIESIPLLTASILSKKLAAGLDAPRHGREIRLRRLHDRGERARARSRRSIVEVARQRRPGRPSALLTDMNEVLGHYGRQRDRDDRGHRLPHRRHARRRGLHERDRRARGRDAGPRRHRRRSTHRRRARRRADAALASGAAAERLRSLWWRRWAGPADLLERPSGAHLAACAAASFRGRSRRRAGYRRARSMCARLPGVSPCVEARRQAHRRVGRGDRPRARRCLFEVVGIGAAIGPGRPLALIHARRPDDAAGMAAALASAFEIADAPPARETAPSAPTEHEFDTGPPAASAELANLASRLPIPVIPTKTGIHRHSDAAAADQYGFRLSSG